MDPKQRRITAGLVIALGIVGGGTSALLMAHGKKTASSPRSSVRSSVPSTSQPSSSTQFTKPGNAAARHALTQIGQLPLRFEINRGQFDADTRFAAHGLGYGLALTTTGPVLSLRSAADRLSTVRLSLVGSRRDVPITPADALPGVINRYRGNDPAAWRSDVQLYARVRYAQVYDGIDAIYYGTDQQRLEYDFEVAPGRDPRTIRLRFDGTTRVSIDDATGDLLLHVKDGEPVRQHAPISYQRIGGAHERRHVDSRYVIHTDGTVGFDVGAYDRTVMLTIDPVLRYSTVFGGASEEWITDLALDSAGNIYITGRSWDSVGFPTTAGLDQTRDGPADAIVTKFNSSGTALVYSTYIGGSNGENMVRAVEHAGRIVVDGAGNAYVAGETNSTDFPTTPGAYDTTYGGGLNATDGFYVKLNTVGQLVYGTYMGGDGYEYTTGIAIDASGNVYVSGSTGSTPGTFTQHPNAFDNTPASGDVFLIKFDPAGTRIYSTFLGGTGDEMDTLRRGGLVVDDAGNAYLVGDTYATDFPIVNGAQTTFGGGGSFDAFLAKIDTTQVGAAGLVYSTYLGGTGEEFAHGIAYAGNGQVVFVGETRYGNFPTKNAFDAVYGGDNRPDVFIARYDTTLTGDASKLFATYFGMESNDYVSDVALDTAGNIHIVGYTNSPNFPLVDQFSTEFFLSQPWVAKFNPTATTLIFSSFYGGTTNGQNLMSVATNAAGHTYIAGITNNGAVNPPTAGGHPLVNPFQTSYGGGDRDGTIAIVGPQLNPNDTDEDGLPNDFETNFGLDPNSGSGDNGAGADPDADGRTNIQEYNEGSHPRGFVITYLAEGATGNFFATRLAIANPTNTQALVLSRLQRADGVIVPVYSVVAAHSRSTLDVETVAGMDSADFSTLIEADVQVVVDRTMTWDKTTGFGSHAERGILTRTATQWYLAEGATHGAFSLFYLLQNPGSVAANVEISYLLPPPAAPIVRNYLVPPATRMTIPVDDEPGLSETDVSASLRSTNSVPFVAERAMYFSLPGQAFAAGHESAGVTSPATRWFLAEGATGSFFNTFILIANPSNQVASVDMSYLLDSGQVVNVHHDVPALSRLTINAALEDPLLLSAAFSTIVNSANSTPIVVERAMWWPADGNGWYEAHNSPGETTTGVRWAMGEGESGGSVNKQTYILIANTSSFAGSARVTLLFEDGTTAEKVFSLPANSRTNVPVAVEFPTANNRRYGAVVDSLGGTPAALVVERAMYADAGGVVFAAGTNALATKLQ